MGFALDGRSGVNRNYRDKKKYKLNREYLEKRKENVDLRRAGYKDTYFYPQVPKKNRTSQIIKWVVIGLIIIVLLSVLVSL